jgi:hypothetical protein
MAQLWFLEIRVGFKATALVWAPYDYIVATLLFISGNDFLAAWLLVNSCRVQILLFFPFAGVYFFLMSKFTHFISCGRYHFGGQMVKLWAMRPAQESGDFVFFNCCFSSSIVCVSPCPIHPFHLQWALPFRWADG